MLAQRVNSELNISKTLSFLKQKKMKGKKDRKPKQNDAKALGTKQIDTRSQVISIATCVKEILPRARFQRNYKED